MEIRLVQQFVHRQRIHNVHIKGSSKDTFEKLNHEIINGDI